MNLKTKAIIFDSSVLLLQTVFITLKLMGIITWGWFYVLLPVIIDIGLFCITAFLIYVFYGEELEEMGGIKKW